MSEYVIDSFTVVFAPWHSEYLDEDFVAVRVLECGREILHAGMTHTEPSEENARKQVNLVLSLRGDA